VERYLSVVSRKFSHRSNVSFRAAKFSRARRGHWRSVTVYVGGEAGNEYASASLPGHVITCKDQSAVNRLYYERRAAFHRQTGFHVNTSEHQNMVALRKSQHPVYSSWLVKTRTLNNSYNWQRRMYIDIRHQMQVPQQDSGAGSSAAYRFV
jgi:hypothetical protein